VRRVQKVLQVRCYGGERNTGLVTRGMGYEVPKEHVERRQEKKAELKKTSTSGFAEPQGTDDGRGRGENGGDNKSQKCIKVVSS